jgi:translocation and assembly module TamB
VKKRRLAFALLVVLLALVAGTLVVLRTRWAGDRICAIAAARVEAATGLAVSVEACRIDPIRLELSVDRLALGPPGAPVFTADGASARLAPVQGLGRRLELAELSLRRPRLALEVPAPPKGGAACPPPWLDAVAVRQLTVADGAVDLGLPGGLRVRATALGVDGRSAEGIGWRLGRAARRQRLAIGAAEVVVERAGQRWRVAQPTVEGAVALDLSGLVLARAEASAGGARFGLRGTVTDLCAPTLDLVATADGTLEGLVGLLGVSAAPWQGHLAVEASLKGRPAAPQVGGTVRFDHLRAGAVAPGAGQGRFRWAGDRIAVEELVVPFAGGALRATGDVRLARGAPLDLAVRLEEVELGELLERVAVPGAWVGVRLDGTGHLSGPVAMPTALVGHVDVQAKGFRALAGPWRAARPGDFTFLRFERGRVRAPFRIDQHGIFFDQARIEVGSGHADVDAAVHFSQERGFEVRAAGDVDLGALGQVAGLPWSGRAQLTARIGAAPYGNPRAEAQVRAEQLRFLRVDLGSATADVTYGPDFTLRFTNVDGQRGQSRYHGFAAVDLARRPTWVTASRFTGSGRLRDFFDAVLDWLPKARVLRDAMDGQVAEVTASAAGPAAALDAKFQGRLGPGELLGRRYDGGRLAGRIAGAEEARFDRLELQYGPGTASATGRWGMSAPFPWSLDVALAGVPVAALGLPGGAWSGSASGKATLAGSWEQPDVHFALNGDAVALRGAPLGTVQLGGTVAGRRVLLTGGADGVRFNGEARLEGRLPWKATAALELLDAARLWPGGPPAGLKAAVEGELTAEGELADLRATRGEVRLDRLQASYADLKLEAAEPIRLRFDRGALEVERFAVRGVDTEFSLTGAVGRGGELDLLAEGALDLRLLGGVLPALRRPHGRLAVEAHVGGTTDEPVLLGDGRLEEAGFQLRGATAALEGLRGDLAFSQNKVLFDALTAQVNGGPVGLSGEVELERLVPARLKVEAQLDEVPVAVPPTLPAVLSGRLEATGTPDETLVTGRLHVVRARYTQDVGLEKGVLDPRRRRAAAPRAYDKAGEWLRFDLQLVVDGDARVDDDLVRGGVKGELTLTGSLAAPGLVGTLAMTDGSRAVFRGNEFALSHAIVDFTDRHKVEMALDVHGESRVSDYQVFMHLFGSMADPQVTLTSAPPLSQPDIITLLSMGFTRHDAPLGAGTQGLATAAAAQALFSASGLDEQVRRFLPSGGPLRDMSVRITSVYSEQTGLVEPRAEFESWVVKDRLRLRYQAPLSGARGQRAQAELRLGDHTALQYQWDTDNRDAIVGDHGLDLKLRWEWTE